ncbi:Tvp23 [Kluyveromyces lactis]|uniref:Golgi apparatus membrane protein TVP23 n=1 Tax=Kluyveromyces lactis (strain ATCC 8585 / CBS 2359 / DSM 70799 / NBRC 1267 / NRRL Y-1140 / WM37) TaxID=284590 RepID=TVP23_KLULA|nr:uncharacterized protein KLLA0_C11869g [Kluyveromyces lactis]Q6CTK9.1 RecName: Full=Golgi apparatus membrane protein TVP23 [Kluyveromyces lactis NRRL Y-1140]QEU59823.1 Tvp23 [Kluyveromyces lactis]CAH01581.1 KLLA0C11869p [Kluyveromyces lactis]|eukprot:XP_452730.1 uncharacterized protein KLLA0_C11869g [Kluyveromyces lactis]
MDSARNFYKTILASSHPLILTIHLLGKAVPIVFYLLGSWFLSSTVQFIIVILTLAADFYFTKNINGRKLIQQRWWYDVSGEDTTTFRFESFKEYPDVAAAPINPIDSKLFWLSLYVAPTIWVVFGFLCLIKFQFVYLILVIFAGGLNLWNAYAYRLCDQWEPGHTAEAPLFQLPMLPSFANLDRVTRLQSFFTRS